MTQDSGRQGSDPLGDFQRWLMRSGARGFTREVRDNLRKTFGYGDAGRDDVWESATNEPPGGEAPECEWCPLCRAARKFKGAGPGLGSHLSSAGDIFATVIQDAVDAFDSALAAKPGPAKPGPAKPGPAESGPAKPGPAKPGPAKPGPAKPGPAESGPAKPGPAKSGPAKSGPAKPPGNPSSPPRAGAAGARGPAEDDQGSEPAADGPADDVPAAGPEQQNGDSRRSGKAGPWP